MRAMSALGAPPLCGGAVDPLRQPADASACGWERLVSYSARGQRYRILGWMYLFAFTILLILQGRSYYLGPGLSVLFAGGAVAWERWLAALPEKSARRWMGATWAALALGALSSAALTTAHRAGSTQHCGI